MYILYTFFHVTQQKMYVHSRKLSYANYDSLVEQRNIKSRPASFEESDDDDTPSKFTVVSQSKVKV